MSSRIEIEVRTAPPYRVRIGSGVLGEVRAYIGGRRALIIADRRVAQLHAKKLGLDSPLHVVEPGEASKSFVELERALDAAIDAGLDRECVIVALGGGVVGDLAGLAASLFMRGIGVIQCPTTLLAQVDASVGGKTAVNLRSGKNLAGTFHQPLAVFADTEVLATLDEGELRSGTGEVLKSAWLDGEASFEWLEAGAAKLADRDAASLARAVELSVRLKARVVESDPAERGARKLLNLGHTFAHAIEQTAGLGRVPHGVAVAVGVALALELALRSGRIADRSWIARTEKVLEQLRLARSLAELRARFGLALAPAELLDAMRVDKKGRGRVPRFVVPIRPGRVEFDVELDESVVLETLA